MPDEDTRDDKNFHEDVPPLERGFFLKGSGAYDWGMQNRLSRIFRPDSGRTVMLAFDHGYFQGPTTGLERVDLGIVPIAP
jgi:3-hydroxy-5-phosphonooxypentane-2,4-dione thiolase